MLWLWLWLWLVMVLSAGLAVLILTPGFRAAGHHLREVAAFDAAAESLALWIVGVYVQRPEADVAQAQGVVAAGVAGAADVEGAAAVLVQADARGWAREALEVVVAEVGVHVAEADDLVAEVAFCCARAVDEFVRGEAGEEDFGVVEVGFAFGLLGDDKVAELAEDGFPWTSGCAVLCEAR